MIVEAFLLFEWDVGQFSPELANVAIGVFVETSEHADYLGPGPVAFGKLNQRIWGEWGAVEGVLEAVSDFSSTHSCHEYDDMTEKSYCGKVLAVVATNAKRAAAPLVRDGGRSSTESAS